MPSSAPENSEPDFEGQFYRLLQEQSGSWEPPRVIDVRKDFFDAQDAPTCGLDSEGNPVLLLKFTPEGCKMILDCVRYWQSHNCSGAAEVALYLLHAVGATLEDLLEHLPVEVQASEPFEH